MTLQQAAQSFLERGTAKPTPSEVVTALLQAEKRARKDHIHYSWEQLMGNWRLYFITGTRKTRQRAGVLLGAGRYLPQWIKIQLSYTQTPLVETEEDTLAGTVVNSVQLGSLQLSLTGPVKFLPQKNILAFDFTRMKIEVFGVTLYSGSLGNGQLKEKQFYQARINQQVFFVYFLIEPEIIAARGRGGGLALWVREHQ